jgi:hypothetical protein
LDGFARGCDRIHLVAFQLEKVHDGGADAVIVFDYK